MTKTQQISAMIVAELNRNGGDIKAAFDKVIGDGAYIALAGSVYEELRARQGL